MSDEVLLLFCGIVPIIALVVFLAIREDKKKKKEPQNKKPEESPEEILAEYKQIVLNSKIYEIHLPPGQKWNPNAARNLVNDLVVSLEEIFYLQIIAEPGRIIWEVVVVDDRLPISDLIKGSYPSAEIIVKDYQPPEFTEPINRLFAAYKLSNAEVPAPIRLVDDLKTDDPLVLITNHMDSIPKNVKLTYSIFVDRHTTNEEVNKAKEKIKRGKPSDLLVGADMAFKLVAGQLPVPTKRAPGTGRTGEGKYIEADQHILEQKLFDQHLYDCYVMVQVDGPLEESFDVPGLPSILTALEEQYYSGYNGLLGHYDENRENGGLRYDVLNPEQEWNTSTIGAPVRNLLKHKIKSNPRPQVFKSILSVGEIAALWHLPNSDFTAQGIEWVSGAKPTKELIGNTQGVILGDAAIAGQKYPIRIHPDDRETHMNIIGQTGVGKSTFMHNLIHQDIQSGKGVCVLDPHGKLVRDILRLSIPDERKNDLLVLDLAVEDYPPPLNPLMGTGDVGEVVSLLEMVEGKIPPVVSDTLVASFVTISKEETPTVRDVIKLFTDGEYRYRNINRVDDVITQEYWEEYESLSRSQQEMRRGPVLHRLRQFYRNPILHPVFCHPKPLNFNELIRQKKIVLMSLGIDERKVPESYRHLVGATLIKQFQMAAMASFQNPTEYFLYIDEVQDFVTAPLDKIFEEARKYKLRLTVANQYLRQLGSILDSIMGTVGATVVFQASLDDARKLGKHFAPEFEQTDLAHMDKYYAAVKTRYLGTTQPAFKIATRPEPQDLFTFDLEGPEAIAREAELREYAIQNSANGLMHVDDVMAWLKDRYPPKVYKVPSQQRPGDAGTDSWIVTEDN